MLSLDISSMTAPLTGGRLPSRTANSRDISPLRVAFADREIVQPLFQRRQVVADPFGATDEQMPLPRRAGLRRPMRLHLFDEQGTEVDESLTGRLALPAAIGERRTEVVRPCFARLKLFEVDDCLLWVLFPVVRK
jgi:hypothetical protein